MPDDFITRSIADWEAEFHRARDRHLLPMSAKLLETCRQLFGEVTATTRHLRQESRLERPPYAALRRLSHDCLLQIRLAHQELAQFDRPDNPTAPVELLERLLLATQRRQETILQQLELIDSTWSLAQQLRPIVEGMLAEDGFPAHRLEPLLHQLDPMKWQGKAEGCVPWPGISWEAILRHADWPHPWFYAEAIHAGRWMAALRGGLPVDEAYPCMNLIAAALLADVGLLAISQNLPGLPSRKDPRAAAASRRHPDISAAMISGLAGASPEWALLAGQHHEHIDGSGLPNRCSGRQLSPATRGFTAAMRWAELLLQSSTAASAHDTLILSAQALGRETQRGAFDHAAVARLFTSATTRPEHRDHALQMPLLDPGHSLAGPHAVWGIDSLSDQFAAVSAGPPSPQYLRHQYRHSARRAPQTFSSK